MSSTVAPVPARPGSNPGDHQPAQAAPNEVEQLRRQLSHLQLQLHETEQEHRSTLDELRQVRAEHERLLSHQHQLSEQLVASVKDHLGWFQVKVEQLETEILAIKNRGLLRRCGRAVAALRGERGYYTLAGWLLGLVRLWYRIPRDRPTMVSWYELKFHRYKKQRDAAYGGVRSLRCHGEPGLVSVVLPVYNGADMVGQAIDSVLAQTYRSFELILVNDGSTDETPQILDRYAASDRRIRVIHQENQQLPRSLSNGFAAARGELLTWTSDDNRLKPDFLERLVACLDRHPAWDMVYANQDIIGEQGERLHGSEFYRGYQQPPGSPHVMLPVCTDELNVWANNYVGAAFLYRRRVSELLGPYCRHRFTIEDYDYWMQVNSLLNLRHSDFARPIYDYRFHGASLTAKERELRILEQREELMVFDDFRRDFALSPLLWLLPERPRHRQLRRLYDQLERRARRLGHPVARPDRYPPQQLPHLWCPSIAVVLSEQCEGQVISREQLPAGCLTVLITTEGGQLPEQMPKCWDLCCSISAEAVPRRTTIPYQGWLACADPAASFTALDIRARTHHLRLIEQEIHEAGPPELQASVVVCTYRRTESLGTTLRSVLRQRLDPNAYELIVVNNDPDQDLTGAVTRIEEEMRQERSPAAMPRVRTVLCPIKGISFARNAGIAEARGEVVCFIDDDAVAEPDWLEQTLAVYRADTSVQVVGGKILLVPPDPAPPWLQPETWTYWSHFEPGYSEPTTVNEMHELPWGANWTARRLALLKIGGFRASYGRKGNDYGGGEEMVSSLLVQRLGGTVKVAPGSVVYHHVDPGRFTLRDLRKTIRSGAFVGYLLQRDLYQPRWLTPIELLRQLRSRLRTLLRPGGLTAMQRRINRYNIGAQLRLLRLQVADYRTRARRAGSQPRPRPPE